MTPLWLAAVALLLLALGLLLPPLLRAPAARAEGDALGQARRARWTELQQDLQAASPQERAQAEDELLRRVLEEGREPPPARAPTARLGLATACVLTLLLPVATLVLYLQAGDPRAAAAQVLAGADTPQHADDRAGNQAAVARLATRLLAKPDDLTGWVVLARSYETLGRFDDAASAWRRAIALAPHEAQLQADLADALGSAQGGDLAGPATAAIGAALALDPAHPKALALAGAAAMQVGDATAAHRHWQKLLSVLPADSEAAQRTRTQLAALDHSGMLPAPRIAGRVSVADALRARVRPQDSVFIVVRSADATIPVAALRLRAADLPASFVLDDRHAMLPGQGLPRATPLLLEVRVSRSQQAVRQAGDLLGAPRGVRLGDERVELVADEVVR